MKQNWQHFEHHSPYSVKDTAKVLFQFKSSDKSDYVHIPMNEGRSSTKISKSIYSQLSFVNHGFLEILILTTKFKKFIAYILCKKNKPKIANCFKRPIFTQKMFSKLRKFNSSLRKQNIFKVRYTPKIKQRIKQLLKISRFECFWSEYHISFIFVLQKAVKLLGRGF